MADCHTAFVFRFGAASSHLCKDYFCIGYIFDYEVAQHSVCDKAVMTKMTLDA